MQCEEAPGCGEWVRPTKANPAYKGKWSAPLIDNPEYKGEWKPRQIRKYPPQTMPRPPPPSTWWEVHSEAEC